MEKIEFINRANNLNDELIKIRRHFHENPELGFEEYETSKYIKAFLDSEGIPYTECAKTGIVALIKGNGNKVVGLRADMDALPMQDKKGATYCSKVAGKMHSCGHDAHMTILMGAAKILNSIKSELNGDVKLIFEPAEETVGGAKFMIQEGALNNPNVDAVIGLHVSEHIDCGKIGVKKGVVNAASNPFTIKIFGKGGHGAHPENTIDPIVITSNIILALQSIVSREIPPTDPAVITVGYVKGGSAQNIIPGEVEIGGIIRTLRTEHREYVVNRVKEVVNGIATSMRGSAEINIEESYPCLYNDDDMYELLNESAQQIIGKDNVITLEKPIMGVESFAYFSLERPSVFYFLGTRNEELNIVSPAHNSTFDIDEKALAIGAAIQAKAAYDFLNK